MGMRLQRSWIAKLGFVCELLLMTIAKYGQAVPVRHCTPRGDPGGAQGEPRTVPTPYRRLGRCPAVGKGLIQLTS